MCRHINAVSHSLPLSSMPYLIIFLTHYIYFNNNELVYIGAGSVPWAIFNCIHSCANNALPIFFTTIENKCLNDVFTFLWWGVNKIKIVYEMLYAIDIWINEIMNDRLSLYERTEKELHWSVRNAYNEIYSCNSLNLCMCSTTTNPETRE